MAKSRGDFTEILLKKQVLSPDQLAEARTMAQQSGAKSVVGDRRYDVPSLIYYLRDRPWPVFDWKSGDTPKDHFELKFPFTGATPEPVLLVTPCPYEPRLKQLFATVTPLGSFSVRTGPTTAPTYHAFKLSGLPREIPPAPACN